MQEPVSWMIGGAQGSGVDTAANLFARACAFAGLHVFGKREYYSNIMGKHSYFQVRVHPERPVLASCAAVHLLATFDVETPMKHFRSVVPDGGIIFDPKLLSSTVDSPPNMERRYKQDLKAYLTSKGRGLTLEDVLNDAADRGVRLFAVPYDDLFRRLGQKIGETEYAKLSRTLNTMAVAVSLALFQFDIEYLDRAIEDQFRGRARIVETNQVAARVAYEYIRETFPEPFAFRLTPVPVRQPRIYLQGTQAVALGKLLAGCTFQTYYPISPATDESVYLESHENVPLFPNGKGHGGPDKAPVVVVQTEDEIAAITMAVGAAIAGARASTATSGPGFCLMMEGLGWAGISEVPVVVTVYQRGGPSTGLPTRTEQGDLWFAIHHGHSEFPRIVIASGDHREMFYDAVRAFNYAERYQVPVIHLTDKYLANSTSTYPLFELDAVRIDRGLLLDDETLAARYADQVFRRYEFTESGLSPRSRPGQKYGIFWMTGDEHDELGHITEDVVLRDRMMEKRMSRLELIVRETPEAEKWAFWGEPDTDTLIVSWGSTKGVVLEAMEEIARRTGRRLGFLQLRMLWPLDGERLAEILRRYARLIAIENNYSAQMAGLIRRETGIAIPHKIVKYNGRPMVVEEVLEAIQQVLQKNASSSRTVLRHGI
ncbi:2-oxoglutarate oxidoreductase subunit KorA [bacterium HR11]|nr:2-oxoglutarate oxidoreductase subunit KorA [bacterium HR11]